MSAATAIPASSAGHLQRLYLARFLFAAAWAGTFAGTGSSLDAAGITLLLLYPAFDVAAAAFDARTSRHPVLYANIAISTAAAIGLAFAAAHDIPTVLRVWGIVAGLAQLFLALKRRGLGGQWAMILSGGISAIAGASFLAQANGATSLKLCAGYAALGGLFFLISAVRLLRTSNAAKVSEARLHDRPSQQPSQEHDLRRNRPGRRPCRRERRRPSVSSPASA